MKDGFVNKGAGKTDCANEKQLKWPLNSHHIIMSSPSGNRYLNVRARHELHTNKEKNGLSMCFTKREIQLSIIYT